LAVSRCGEQAYRWDGDDLILRVSVQPRSSINAITEINDHCVKIKLTSAPVDGKANQSLTKLLSKAFGVSASQISIEKGEISKTKRIRISTPKILPALIKTQ
jgi:hypothetical protein